MSPEPMGDPRSDLLAQSITHLSERIDEFRRDSRTQMDAINGRLDKLVTQEAFGLQQARVDGLLGAMAEDIKEVERRASESLAAERIAREKGDNQQQTLLDKLGANIKWVGVSVLLPVALFAANLYANRGG